MNRLYTTKITTQDGNEIEVTKRFLTGFVAKTEEINGFTSISVGTADYRDGKKVTEYINRITVSKSASDKFKEFILGIPAGSKVAIVANVVEMDGKNGKTYTNHYLEAIDICYLNKKNEKSTSSSVSEDVKAISAPTSTPNTDPVPPPNTVLSTPDICDDVLIDVLIDEDDLPF